MTEDLRQRAEQAASWFEHKASLYTAWATSIGTGSYTRVAKRATADGQLIRDLLTSLEAITRERGEAMLVLNPSMPESGLVDACRQVKQAAISEADNSSVLERKLAEAEAREWRAFEEPCMCCRSKTGNCQDGCRCNQQQPREERSS